MDKVQLTQEGLEKLKIELQELKTAKRPSAVERLQKARGMGDLSENSEYSSSKEELAFIEKRIQEIEEILKNAHVVEANHSNGHEVVLGTSVTVSSNQGEEVFHIVGEFESDPMQKKLSYTSPIGKALVGKKIGDVINVEVPNGKLTFKVLKIN